MAARFRDLASGARVLLGILSSRWVFGGPRSVALSITDVCNVNCVMCWCHSPLVRASRASEEPPVGGASLPRVPRPPHMDPALFETILRESRRLGTYRAVLCGHGEPALHPQFDRMLELMMELDMEPYVLTNGLALDDARAKVWATKRAHFRFSMQGGDVETWLRGHPGSTAGQFERLSRAIRTLVAAGTARVSTMHVIHRESFRHVREMVEHARDHGVREVLFRPVRAEGELASLVLDPDEEDELRRDLRLCLQLAAACGIRTNLREYLETSLHTHAGVLRTEDVYRRVPCYIGWVYAEFDIDGTLTPCIHSKVVMGRAGEETFRALWHSPRYCEFRREARTMPQRGEPVKGCQCHACPMFKYNTNIYSLLRLRSLKYGEA